MTEEEKFFAWLDGELPADEAAKVEAAVAANPELSQLAREHRSMAAGLRHSFDSVVAEPLPERLVQSKRIGNEVASLADARAARAGRVAPRLWAQMGALAATLAAGIFAGSMLGNGADGPVAPHDGLLVASADLEDALHTRLASAPVADGPRIGLTFRDKTGAICRTFEDHSAIGLACREDGNWQIRALFQGETSQTTDYRMASGADPRLMETVDAAVDGEMFDAAQERAAMKRGWH